MANKTPVSQALYDAMQHVAYSSTDQQQCGRFTQLLEYVEVGADDSQQQALNLAQTLYDLQRQGETNQVYVHAVGAEYTDVQTDASAVAQAMRKQNEILSKIAGKSATAASTISVPNSLGPAELLLHYGTEEQKKHHLPRLASGESIPCFALTNAEAGSDAGAIPDTGVVVKHTINGESVLGVRLTCNKRYITLAPVATLIGMAFQLRDPEQLLSSVVERGITIALIDRDSPGLDIGRRHLPTGSPFANGPIKADNVFVPLANIIGDAAMIGQGWRMLTECLSAGRAISLPAISSGSAKMATLNSNAYTRLRKQFGLPLAKFEGVAEVLARMNANLYLIEATRKLTCIAVDQKIKPAITSAISKYHITERSRQMCQDAMDVHGGKAICLGPKNTIANGYAASPIAITVEGANILTRCLIIFGQGMMRCHPHLYQAVSAANTSNRHEALAQFDRALVGHIGFFSSNLIRSLLLGLAPCISRAPVENDCKRYFQQLTRLSSALAMLADVAMLLLGGHLKRKESLVARLGDVLSHLYMGSAVLKQHYDHASPKADLPLVHVAMQQLLYDSQQQLLAFIENLPTARWLKIVLRCWVFPLGARLRPPSDQLGLSAAHCLQMTGESRLRLAENVYLANVPNNPAGQLDYALDHIVAAEAIEHRLHAAVQQEEITCDSLDAQLQEAVAKTIVSQQEADLLKNSLEMRAEIIAVDDFADGQW